MAIIKIMGLISLPDPDISVAGVKNGKGMEWSETKMQRANG